MKRTEKNEIRRKNKIYRIKVFFGSIFTFIFLSLILYTGLTVVDKTNRSVLLLEDTAFLRYNEIEKDFYEIIFCGDKYSFNTTELNNFINNTKNETKNSLEYINNTVENQRKQLGKIVSKIYENNQ